MSGDLKIWQPICWMLAHMFFCQASNSAIKRKYIEGFGNAWRDWLRSAYIIKGMNIVIHLMWAGGCYFVWASKDPKTLQRPATWDSDREALILYFGVSLSVSELFSTVLFWKLRLVALGSIGYIIVLILNITTFVLCILNEGQDGLTCVLFALPWVWLVILIYVTCAAWWLYGSMGPSPCASSRKGMSVGSIGSGINKSPPPGLPTYHGTGSHHFASVKVH